MVWTRSIASIVGFIFIVGCSDNSRDTDSIRIFPSKEIDNLSDTTFFTNYLDNMDVNDDYFIMADSKFSRVYILDHAFNHIKTIGRKGRGPGDFNYFCDIVLNGNTIYVFDCGNKRIALYDIQKDTYSYISYPIGSIYPFNSDIDKLGNIFTSNFMADNPIIVIDSNGEVINSFGTFIEFNNNSHKQAINMRHILLDENGYVINIFASYPRLEVYSTSGEYVTQFDLSTYCLNFLEYKQTQLNENPGYRDRATFEVFEDVQYHNGYLYLLLSSHNHDDALPELFKINLKDYNDIFLEERYTFDTEVGKPLCTTFSVIGNKIIIYEIFSMKLLVYDINVKK